MIQTAVSGAENYVEAGEEENETLQNTVDYLDSVVASIKGNSDDDDSSGSTETDLSTLTEEERLALVGQYVAYTPDSGTYSTVTSNSTYTGLTYNNTNFTTDKSLNWQIWSISDDTLTLIADDIQDTGGYYYSSNGYYTLCLAGLNGYTNGVNILNEICNTCYSNSNIGAIARSINIEDIEDVLDWDYWNPLEFYYSSTYPCYDSSITLPYIDSSYSYYPNLWAEEDFSNIDGEEISASYTYNSTTKTKKYDGEGLRRSDNLTTLRTSATRLQANSYIEVTNTYWGGSSCASSSNAFLDYAYRDLLYIGKNYWLASRTVVPGSTCAYFRITVCHQRLVHQLPNPSNHHLVWWTVLVLRR